MPSLFFFECIFFALKCFTKKPNAVFESLFLIETVFCNYYRITSSLVKSVIQLKATAGNLQDQAAVTRYPILVRQEMRRFFSSFVKQFLRTIDSEIT